MRNAFLIAAMCAAASAANGQVTLTATLDRWWYPFNSQPGAEPQSPIFAAIREPGFDDRDAQFVVAFDTSAALPPGLDAARYQITSVRLRIVNSAANRFTYDPTFDSVSTLYAADDPQRTPDADPGKPIEVFAAGYRNGVTAASLAENTPYSTLPPFPPQEGVRSVFAAAYDNAGNAADISRQVRQKFEATPLAIGQTTDAAPGELVLDGAEFTFDISQPGGSALAYLRAGLQAGRIVLVVSSLHPASGGPGGGTGDPAYPAIYTKENALGSILGYAPKLEVTAFVAGDPDFNQDGGVDVADIQAFFDAFSGLDPNPPSDPDMNSDGGIDVADIDLFFRVFSGT